MRLPTLAVSVVLAALASVAWAAPVRPAAVLLFSDRELDQACEFANDDLQFALSHLDMGAFARTLGGDQTPQPALSALQDRRGAYLQSHEYRIPREKGLQWTMGDPISTNYLRCMDGEAASLGMTSDEASSTDTSGPARSGAVLGLSFDRQTRVWLSVQDAQGQELLRIEGVKGESAFQFPATFTAQEQQTIAQAAQIEIFVQNARGISTAILERP